MACLDMYNSDHKNHHHHHHHHHRPPTSPRISFSSDFVDIQQALKQERTKRESPPVVSNSDFEFSVSNYSMMSADELFFEGRLLPFKDQNSIQHRTTLRDELLIEENEEGDGDEEEDDEDEEEDEDSSSFSQRPSKGRRWKGFLGLKKSNNNGSKKTTAVAVAVAEGKRPFSWTMERAHVSKTSQGVENEGGESSSASR